MQIGQSRGSEWTRNQHAARGHAVVIGGGVSGLCAAHALSRSFARVTVLDARAPGARAMPGGAPMWVPARGQRELEWLMPGFVRELRAAGARLVDTVQASGVEATGHGGVVVAHPLRSVSAPKALECTTDTFFRACAHRLARRPGVAVLHRSHALMLRMTPGRFARVCGVALELASPDPAGARQRIELEADLVVDASGPSSRLLRRSVAGGEPRGSRPDVLEVFADERAMRRRFDGDAMPPEGLLPLGSTVLSTPRSLALQVPIAALGARALEETLAVESIHAAGFTRRFLANQARSFDDVWRWLVEFAEPGQPAIAQVPAMARHRYLKALRSRARNDAELAGLVARIDQLVEPVDHALDPRIMWRVLRPTRRSGAAA